jgi:hypothetical protein
VFEGRHYGPGLVDVPDHFPAPTGEQRQLTEDATAMQYFEQHREEFEAFRRMKQGAAQNDAGLAQPFSGESGVPATETGSNHGAQTGVSEDNAPDNAAGKQEGDVTNANTSAANATGTTSRGGVSTVTGAAPGAARAGTSGADRPAAPKK